MTYRELVYMCLDELKLSSDDSYITPDHIIFLADKYRVFLIHQRYIDIRKPIPESNYSELCLDLIKVPALDGEPCDGGFYLRSKEKIPFILKGTIPNIYPIDFYQGIYITYVNRNRMKFVGHNKWLSNIIYCSISPDNYLYFKSSNPQFLYLEKVKMSAILEDSKEGFKLSCNKDEICDILDMEFPMEATLVPALISLIVQELAKPVYSPEDKENNAEDDLSEVQIKE